MKSIQLALWACMAALTTFGIFATAYAQGGDVNKGAQLFAKNCAVCHGDRAEGRVGARLAKDFPGIRVDALLNETISNGVQGSVMPAWSQSKGGPLTDAEITDLVAFVRSLGHQAPTVPAGPSATIAAGVPPAATFPPGNANRGAAVFSQNCAVCHGDRGQGRIGAILSKDWPGVEAQLLIEATIARGVAGSKMPAWSKSYGGPLTEQEISDAAAFIRTLRQSGGPSATAGPEPLSGLAAGPFALICGGLVIVIGVAALGIGLAGSRSRRKD